MLVIFMLWAPLSVIIIIITNFITETDNNFSYKRQWNFAEGIYEWF